MKDRQTNSNEEKEGKTPSFHHYQDIVDRAHSEIVWVRTAYKWLISIVGIVILVGLYFSYKSASDFKSEMRKEINELKVEAKNAIEKTQKLADNQISQIRISADKIALEEAQNRIDNAFKENNVKKMIESAAKREVGTEIERQVSKEVNIVMDNLQDDITSLGLITDAAMRMRIGLRDGLDELIKIQKTSTDSNIKERAKLLLKSIADDYDRIGKEIFKEMGGSVNVIGDLKESKDEFKDENNIIPDLMKVIHSKRPLEDIALAIIVLREKTGEQFNMFDIENIERWYKKNK